MRLLKTVGTALVALSLISCASVPEFQPLKPRTSSISEYLIARSPLLDRIDPSLLARTDHTTKYLDQNSQILYFQNHGGGGGGVALLLGPLGAVANMSMIEETTKADVDLLRGKIRIDPSMIFMEAANKQGLSIALAPASDNSQITPYLYISKSDSDRLLVAVAIILEQGTGTEKWIGKYMYQLPLSFSVADLAQLDQDGAIALRSASADGFSALLRHVTSEKPEAYLKEQPIVLKSDLLTPKVNFELQGMLISADEELVWIRTAGGIYAVQKTNISYKHQRP